MTETLYIKSASSLKERYDRICTIIYALEDILLDSTGQSDIDEYKINDGQMKIETIYRSVEDMVDGINKLEVIRERIFNQLNGRNVVLRPHQGLR